ncbi:MAG: hypothetical protein V9G29_14860 [Burkholderiaceae bacterium]
MNILASASSRISETALPCGLKALVAISSLADDELAQDRALANDLRVATQVRCARHALG